MLAVSGLRVATLTHRAFLFHQDREAARSSLLETIEIAAYVGAETITMTTGVRSGASWLNEAQRFVEANEPCVPVAECAKITLVIEPTLHLYADAAEAGLQLAIRRLRRWFSDQDT